jgi:hypothetical protein
MSKGPGKHFEADIIDSIPDRCDVTRLKDAGGWSKSDDLRFTIKNPCDFIVYSHRCEPVLNSMMYKLELKSCLKRSLPYANIKPKTPKLTAVEASIKFVTALVESENKGVWAGFIVNFRDYNETYRVLASDVLDFLQNESRKSIPLDWFQSNGILIPQTLKIKHYRYDMDWL